MKLKDYIQQRMFETAEKKPASMSNYYDTLAEQLFQGYIEYKTYENVEKSDRIYCVELRTWICTDTKVGLYLYILDDEPVCMSYQTARKSPPDWHFFSKADFYRLRNFFLSMREKEEIEDDLSSIHELEYLMELDLSRETKGQITNEDIGLPSVSGFYEFRRYIDKGIIPLEAMAEVREMVNKEIEKYDDFILKLHIEGKHNEVIRVKAAMADTMENLYYIQQQLK